MEKASVQNKQAWEYNAYEFWIKNNGTPEERAEKCVKDPLSMLKKYARYFGQVQGQRIAVVCGSCGKKAIPLAILGAEITIFDISKENMRYALETAKAAGVEISYELGDFLDADLSRLGESFDVVFMEGGVLHYFFNLALFCKKLHGLLRKNGRLIMSDFHPIHKCVDVLGLGSIPEGTEGDYFSSEVVEAEMPHAKFYDDQKRAQFPKCRVRRYTISEIINTVLRTGFVLRAFDEHPGWNKPTLPGEFTILADKV